MAFQKVIMYTDGGARGNPGKAAVGVVIEPIGKEFSATIGEATNNIAEYRALIFGLQKLEEACGREKSKALEVEVRSDSELMVKQLNGVYRVKDEKLQPLFVKARELASVFKKVIFTSIPREKNKRADALVNEALDKQKAR